MEIFSSCDVSQTTLRLDAEESVHCVKVLRHHEGDEIRVMDGRGNLYLCRILSASPKGVEAAIESVLKDYGAHPYKLTMAVCPTKNPDRYEWFVEKAVEMGVDTIVPVIGDRSERRVVKGERLSRIALSAAKQSLKAAVPQFAPVCTVREYIESAPADALKIICYCFEDRRISIQDALCGMPESREVCILIGPEGDFSPQEVKFSLEKGFVPVHLGPSRLRTETAAVTAVAAVYLKNL